MGGGWNEPVAWDGSVMRGQINKNSFLNYTMIPSSKNIKTIGFIFVFASLFTTIKGEQQHISKHVSETTSSVSEKNKLKLANLFTDNMVLQQGIKVPVWGEASPKEIIRIELDGTVTSTKADKEGKWLVKLPEHKAGGPFVMNVSGTTSSIVLNNVMVGEVWLASGQSNMAFTMDKSSQADIEIPEANYPSIRLITVPLNTSPEPISDIKPTKWEMCTPTVVKSFSAVAYYFAKKMHNAQNVPIGIISTSLGSSAAEAWTSRNMLEQLPEFHDRLLKLDADTAAWNAKVAKINDYEQRVRREISLAAAEGVSAGVPLLDYNDSAWKTSDFPMNMRKLGLPGYWGFIWFRQEFNLTKAQMEKNLRMELPIYCDDFLLYFNGIETGGRIYKQPMPSSYIIPKDRLKEGKNVIAIRMRTYFGTGYIGTSDSKAPEIVSTDDMVHIAIAKGWKFNATIEPKIYPNQEYFNTPTVLYNGMISPIIPYGMKGVIWYQGETNASRPIEYRTLFPALIRDWRKKWNQGDFPFLFVQLASRLREGVADMQYAMVREAQTYALKLPNTAMATAVDLGEKNDTHPKNKKDVGLRLALAALRVAYHQDIVFSGPVYQSVTIEGDKIRLAFSNTGSGLMVKGQELKGFKIAGKDGVFYPATAFLSGNEVWVNSPKVPLPKAVRYCFESWSEGNLYNKEGIAAPQFRTDDWEIVKNSK